MSFFDILSGKKPLVKGSKVAKILTGIGASDVLSGGLPFLRHPRSDLMLTVEQEFSALFNLPAVIREGPTAPALKGTFDTLAAARDSELAFRGGDLQNIKQLVIPVLTAGEVSGSPFSIGECTGLLLAARTTGDSGMEYESSDTARIYVEINRSSVWIPMSFNIAAQGSQKGDAQFIAGPISWLRIRVVNITQDITQPIMILWLMRGVAITGQFGGAVSYGGAINTSQFGGWQVKNNL